MAAENHGKNLENFSNAYEWSGAEVHHQLLTVYDLFRAGCVSYCAQNRREILSLKVSTLVHVY